MSEGKSFLKFAAGLLLAVALIFAGFQIYKITQPQTSAGLAQYGNTTAQFNDIDKTTYEDTLVSGAEVLNCIRNFAKDEDCAVLVKTGDDAVVCYSDVLPATGEPGLTLTDAVTLAAGPSWLNGSVPTTTVVKRIASLEAQNTRDAGYIAASGQFKGKICRDENQVIRFIAFEQQ